MSETYRTPELLLLLLNSVANQQDGIASTTDVMSAGKVYLIQNYGAIERKPLEDTIRWSLIHMADELNWLTRPFGKLAKGNTYARRKWLKENRPLQNENQTVWQITQTGYQHLEAIPIASIDSIVDSDIESQEFENELFVEGRKKRFTSYYERNKSLRRSAVKYHRTICEICEFDFAEKYGEHGFGFIEIHHLKPVSSLNSETIIDPKTDMIAVCANCHRMLHRQRNNVLSPEELKKIIQEQRQKSA